MSEDIEKCSSQIPKSRVIKKTFPKPNIQFTVWQKTQTNPDNWEAVCHFCLKNALNDESVIEIVVDWFSVDQIN